MTRARTNAGMDLLAVPTAINPLWDDVTVPLLSSNSSGASAPSLARFQRDLAGTSQGVYTFQFSATVENELFGSIQMPHRWKLGSAISPHLHWSPGASTNPGAVRWGLEYTIASAVAGANIDYPVTVLNEVDQAAGGVANRHQIAEFTDIVMTGQRASCVILFRLYRAATHANDTFTAVAHGLSFDIHFQADSGGGSSEYSGAI